MDIELLKKCNGGEGTRSLETSESDLQLTQRHVPEQRKPHLFPVLLIN